MQNTYRSEKVERPGDTVDEVYRRLRDLIVEGVYRPGERLPHTALSERLSAGRTPIRQALHRLQADGLVIATPNRGVRVAPAALGSAEELYGVRVLVEPPLIAALAGRFTEEQLGEMRDELAAMEASTSRTPDFQRAHRDFHLVAVAAYSSPFVADLVLKVHSHLFRHQQLYMARPPVPDDFLRLDRELLDALEAGDGARARHLFEFHLIDAAVGLVLDVDPDHPFDFLFTAAGAQDIAIEACPDGRIQRPARLTWRKPVGLPQLVTSNLRYEGEG